MNHEPLQEGSGPEGGISGGTTAEYGTGGRRGGDGAIAYRTGWLWWYEGFQALGDVRQHAHAVVVSLHLLFLGVLQDRGATHEQGYHDLAETMNEALERGLGEK